jgi:CheY-like chemotaxis protein
VEAISSSGKGLLTLINGILDLSKIEAGKMELEYEPVNPHTLFDEIGHIFALQAAEKKIDFSVSLDPSIPNCLMLDEVRLKQILFNLIGNAVKFTEKGHVRITVEKLTAPEKDTPGIGLHITVEDTGIGIAEQHQGEIFQAFKQKDGQSTKRFGGTGLGLSITKRLVEMMGGTIGVQSQENRGSRFLISIPHVPVVSPCTKDQPDEGFIPEEIAFDRATFLIADDIANNRLLIKEFLRQTDITIVEAENGRQAVLAAQKHKPDVILMDLRMPVLSGPEALKQISVDPDTRSIPIIAMTASGMKEEHERIMSHGFAGFLTKPIRKATLFQELIRFVGHGTKETQDRQAPDDAAEEPDYNLLPEVIEQLENRYMTVWSEVRKNLFFEQIGEFASQISRLGDDCAVAALKSYGDNLSAHVENFDVENMNTALETFPELVASIKHLHEQRLKEYNRGSEQ